MLAKLLGKTKSVKDPRPDYFHLNEETNNNNNNNMALHGEFDETDDHEEDEERLRVIAHHAGCGANRVYYFRVKARLGTPRAVCERIMKKDLVYYQMTQHGIRVLQNVAAYVRECLDRMSAGQLPEYFVLRRIY